MVLASFSSGIFHLLLCQFFDLASLTADSICHVADFASVVPLGAAPTSLVCVVAASLLMIDSLDFNRLLKGASALRLGLSRLFAGLLGYSFRFLGWWRICP